MMMDCEGLIKPWGIFLSELAKELTASELRDVILLIGDKLSAREKERIQDPQDLLDVLDEKGLIGEDNTGLVREIFKHGGLEQLIHSLDAYELKRREYVQRVALLAGRRDPLFVGRDTYIRDILDFFDDQRHPGLKCICLWGMAGSGKTKLGAETCAIYAEMKTPKPKLFLVDLNKKTSIEDVGMTLLSSVGHPVRASDYDARMVWTWMHQCCTEHVLLFDNADDLLKPTSPAKDHFQNMLRESIQCTNPNVKIIITSRYAIKFQFLSNHPNYTEKEVGSLEMEEAVLLLTKSVQRSHDPQLQVVSPSLQGRVGITEEQAMQLAECCGCNPQALRAVASQLRSGKKPDLLLRLLSNHEKMELVLNDQVLWGLGQDATEESAQGSMQVLECLGVMFDDMMEALKPFLVRLSVLPGIFSKSQGLSILSYLCDSAGQDELEFYLENIASTSLLLRESLDIFQSREGEEERYYSMHPLVRCLCLMQVEKREVMKEAFQAGLLSFIRDCFQLLQDFTKYDDRDPSGSLQRLEKEKTNIYQFLEIEMRKTFDGRPHPLVKYLPNYGTVLAHSNIAHNTNILAFMERFMFTKERSTFFEQRAEAARAAGDFGSWVNHQGWFADQQLQLHRYDPAEAALRDPLSYCGDRLPSLDRELKEGYCQCLYVQGYLLVQKPQDRPHMQIENGKEGTRILENCLEMRLSNLGDSVVTARTINALGSCLFRREEYDQALKRHLDALQMMERVTDGRPEIHPDATFYLMNAGTCYHELGYRYSATITQKEKGKYYFQKAIAAYNKGREMLRGVGLEKTSIMAVMLKNLAMTYCEMEEYEEALNFNDQATGIRKQTLGDDHPDVARSHYFSGSLYMSMGDRKKKRGVNVYEIEEYRKAKECFDHALEVEIKVGYGRRSMDYDDLKADLEILLVKKLCKKTAWERYRVKFKQHEEGSLAPITKPQTSDSKQQFLVSKPRYDEGASTSSGGDSQERKRIFDQQDTGFDFNPDSPPDPKKCLLS